MLDILRVRISWRVAFQGVLGLVYASPALADWGEPWGTLVWGAGVPAVPLLDGWGLSLLLIAVCLVGAYWTRRSRPGLAVSSLVVALVIPLAVAAGTVTVPNTFTNGTAADADAVNANFDAVKTAVNDNDNRITTAQSTADSNAAGISSAFPVISGNTSNISTNTAGIASSATAISGNTSNVSTNAAGISSSATAISGNTSNISTNAAGISSSATAISGNTTSIAALEAQGISACRTLLAALVPRFRFEACADGLTVADGATGLLWERKTGTFDASFPASSVCETAVGGCPDRHNVNNRYAWSNTGTAPDGNAYTDFLVNLNAGSGFAGHTDWRLPVISELQSILVGTGVTVTSTVTVNSTNVDPPDPAMGTNPTGQPTICGSFLCIDPRFTAIGGPTVPNLYWSASSVRLSPFFAWNAIFGNGLVGDGINKTADGWVRAVRAGTCGS